MKTYPLIALAGLLLAFASCKKSDSEVADSKIAGKWNVVKITIKNENLTTGTEVDTTYVGTALNRLDFIQFKSDGTALFSQSGIFNIIGDSFLESSNNSQTAETFTFNYSIAGATVTLSKSYSPPYVPHAITEYEGPYTLQLDANNMFLEHVTFNNATNKIIADTYYTKAN